MREWIDLDLNEHRGTFNRTRPQENFIPWSLQIEFHTFAHITALPFNASL